MRFIRWLDTLTSSDVPLVGGKNASLGEMLRTLKEKGIQIPNGFATTADAYWEFLEENHFKEEIAKLVQLPGGGKTIRKLMVKGRFSDPFVQEISQAYAQLAHRDVAVRSSATAEDLPEASFAGQQETFLHVTGVDALLEACKKCYASLFTDRAISYRNAKGFDHLKIALSIGVQKMVRSDLGSAGVLFTLDPETGFRKAIVINAAWGLGENVVQGTITPDEYVIFKPLLSIITKTLGEKEEKMVYAKKWGKTTIKNVKTTAEEKASFVLQEDEIRQLGKWALAIEAHYGMPMDIEWAKDGQSGQLFIVQARPETVHSQKKGGVFKTYRLKEKGKILAEGLAIGESIACGKAQVIKSIEQIGAFKSGSFLVTRMTSPDWVPIMEKAAGIITDHGGRTSHAAIVSRELGLPAIVGTAHATSAIQDGQEITLSCAEGERGFVYEGRIPFEEKETSLDHIPQIQTQILMNIASPLAAFRWWRLPCQGIGLARMEFIINNIIQIHPMALVHLDLVKERKVRQQIEQLTRGYKDKREYFVDHLSQGIAKIAASRYPDPAIVRMSDFKTNEYANLIGGVDFEPKEENPMLGFRGASRYYSPRYREGFALECQAIKRVREAMGLNNVLIMIPFCRTLEEADKVLQVLEENGLKRHDKGLEIYVMCEIPSNVILAEEFAKRFDGFSIGSNDLTQLILGVDRDSAELAPLFDERNPAVTKMIEEVIAVANRTHCKVGICGQAPSDHPDFAAFLVRAGINSISLNPDSIVGVIQRLSQINK